MTPDSLMGQKIGPYRIESIIGRGGVSVVYRARRDDNSIVALKMLFAPQQLRADLKKRFAYEAAVGALLSHPGIVHVVDYGEIDGFIFMAMNMVEGKSLTERLAQERILSQADAADIGWQLADALHYAHKQGVIHRDLKPSNILLTNKGLVCLIDLGVAVMKDRRSLDEPGALIGTPNYISPEQAEGRENIDGRADLYSLGVLMYRMVTGRTPFQGTNAEILHAQIHDTPPPPEDLAPISAEMAAFLRQALAKDPDERFQTGAEMARELARLSNVAPAPKVVAEPEAPAKAGWGPWILVGVLSLIFGSLLLLGLLQGTG